MRMAQVIALECGQRLVQVVDPGMAESALPRTRERLNSRTTQKALEFLSGTAPDLKWRDSTDLVLCQMLPGFTEGCRAFYADEGKQLKELVTEATLKRIDEFLIRTLQVAEQAHEAGLVLRWAELAGTME